MNEQIEKAWAEANANREQRLKDLRGTLTLEERLTQLEEMVVEQNERLVLVDLPEYDELINRAVRNSHDTSSVAEERYHQSVQEVNEVKRELEKSIRETLKKTVDELIASSNADIVVNALREALKSTVLITRQASRGELANVGVLVTRPATRDELKESK